MNIETPMITWVLVDEPTADVVRAIRVVEARVGSDGEVSWVSPVVDVVDIADPNQD